MMKKKRNLAELIPICFFVVLICLFIYNVNQISAGSDEQAVERIQESVRRSAIHCYAIEGQYPNNVEYLEDNYGLHYNHDRFTVHYESVGANILPDIFVTRSGDNG